MNSGSTALFFCLCVSSLPPHLAISPQQLNSINNFVKTDAKSASLFKKTPEFPGFLQTILEYMKVSREEHFKAAKDSRNINEAGVSIQCFNDTVKVCEDIAAKQEYAVRLLDADAKLPSGILQGMWFWPGDYRECINTESTPNTNTSKQHKFKGRYFTVKLHEQYFDSLPIANGLVVGVCLPDSCESQDVTALINLAFKTLSGSNKTVVKNVYTTERRDIDSSDIAAIVICSVLLLTVLIGTVIDYYDQRQQVQLEINKIGSMNGYANIEAEINERTSLLADSDLIVNNKSEFNTNNLRKFTGCLKAFSFFSNTKKLMNTTSGTGPLACLNGLRVISMFWVIQGHTFGFSVVMLKDPIPAETMLYERFSYQAIVQGDFSVDTFFFLSGLLVAYLAMKELSLKGKLNWVYFFLHRYWRLTPMYAICLMFFTTVYVLMLTGPYIWTAVDQTGPYFSTIHECRTYWWSNLLYINNMYPHYGSETNCMGWAWYLANDMQFYMVLSPLVIMSLHKNRKVGVAFCTFLIVASIGSRAFIVYYYGMNQSTIVTKHTDDPWGQNGPLYTKPYARWSVYIAGMLTGYLLQVTNCKIRMNIFYTVLGWALSTAIGLSLVYGLYHYNNTLSDMSEGMSIFYVSCCRTAWSLSLAWLVTACATGKGGWINAILSWKLWAPLGRLTYAAYLVHPMVIFGFYINLVSPIPFTDLLFVYLFMGNVVLSYGAAYLVSMVIEAPMMQLEKLFLNKSH